jgi:type IV secretory pathway TraG/TraD family ATPase VirD4
LVAAPRSTDVLRWVNTREIPEVDAILSAAGPTEAHDEAWANWKLEERQLSSIIATTRIVLKAFSMPKVAAMCDYSEIDLEDLLDGEADTLYLCAPPYERRWLRPVFATLVEQVINYVYKLSVEGEPLKSPLLVSLDEAANIAPLRELDTYASTAAGVGMQLVTVWQDVAQMTVRYEDRAHSALDNHRDVVFLSSISDPSTLDYASRSSVTTSWRMTRSPGTWPGYGRRRSRRPSGRWPRRMRYGELFPTTAS